VDASWLSQSEADLPAGTGWLGPREADRLAGMRFAKRRNDFLLGRWTAKRAVARCLGLPQTPQGLAAVEVWNRDPARADGGAPAAFVHGEPAALEVSISDRAGWAVCTVRPGAVAIGCDLELVEPRSARFVADYFTPAECAAVAAARCAQDRDRLANLFWSAKESALKVLRTGLRRDTRSVEVVLEREPAGGGWAALRLRVDAGTELGGWWRQFGPFLVTFAAAERLPPPASYDEPPSLLGARPSHSWMAQPLVSAEG
jgi:4'-phosphopantetheinyl transferase